MAAKVADREIGMKGQWSIGEFRIDSNLWITPERHEKWLLRRLLDTEQAAIKYQDRVLGIERRWDELMKRRSQTKRCEYKVVVDLTTERR